MPEVSKSDRRILDLCGEWVNLTLRCDHLTQVQEIGDTTMWLLSAIGNRFPQVDLRPFQEVHRAIMSGRRFDADDPEWQAAMIVYHHITGTIMATANHEDSALITIEEFGKLCGWEKSTIEKVQPKPKPAIEGKGRSPNKYEYKVLLKWRTRHNLNTPMTPPVTFP